ncbi:MAG: hypothetical protein QM742_02490 [Aquabacterium sp.]
MNHAPNDEDDRLDDARLKQAVRGMPSPLSARESTALQERILAQWQDTHGATASTVSGSVLVWRAGQGRTWRMAAAALLMALMAASGWWAWRAQQETAIDEDLLHPDVLTLMAIEEM